MTKGGHAASTLARSSQLLAVVDDVVVVAVDNGRKRAAGLDAATGAVRWRITF